MAGKVYQAASSALPRMILSAASGDEEMVQGMHDLLQQWTDAEQAEVLFSARRGIGEDVSLGSDVAAAIPASPPPHLRRDCRRGFLTATIPRSCKSRRSVSLTLGP